MKISNRKLVYADDICRYIKTEINPYGKPFQGSAYELGLKLIEYIEEMSDAYDINKVEKDIKELSIRKFGEIKTDDVIKIIQVGGINQTD